MKVSDYYMCLIRRFKNILLSKNIEFETQHHGMLLCESTKDITLTAFYDSQPFKALYTALYFAEAQPTKVLNSRLY